MTDEILFTMGPWLPEIFNREGNLFYRLPIESGFASWTAEIPITEPDLTVLLADTERYVFLGAALYPILQINKLDGDQSRSILDAILHASNASVETFLTLREKQHNGGVSHFVKHVLGYDQSRMRAGHWFAT